MKQQLLLSLKLNYINKIKQSISCIPSRELFEAQPQLVMMLRDGLARDGLQECHGHFERSLIHRRAHTTLQHHLQYLRIGRVLHGRVLQLVYLFLQVFDSHLNWTQYNLKTRKKKQPNNNKREDYHSCQVGQ